MYGKAAADAAVFPFFGRIRIFCAAHAAASLIMRFAAAHLYSVQRNRLPKRHICSKLWVVIKVIKKKKRHAGNKDGSPELHKRGVK